MPGTANSGGRNKQSARDHVVKGTFRTDRHAEDATPEAPKGVPTPPKPLEGDALEEWLRMVGRLAELGTLSTVDDAALYQYCQFFAETEALAVRQLETAGSARIMEDNLAGLKGTDLTAAFQEITKLRALEAGYATKIRQGRMGLRAWLVEFGMTPAARTRVKASGQPVKSKVEQFRESKRA